jgi:signal peptidase I
MGPVRVNLEAFGVAILAAVLLKWFCIEAFQIPTSSMQPTLMGSTEAGVFDRILVNKILPLFREPQRWDITVFKYPLQKNQNYVKRIGGMPGDRLLIGGGNLYLVTDADGRRTMRAAIKPDDLQEHMWKNVFPGRALARSETKWLDGTLGCSPARSFREEGEAIAVDVDNTARVYFRDEVDGGMVDRVWDGYPAAVARAIREKSPPQPQEIVPDVRIAAAVTADATVTEVAFEVEVRRPNCDTWIYALAIKGGKGQLQVRKDKAVLGQSEPFDLALAADTATAIAFAHVDDELIAWRDGEVLQRFDSSAWACRDGCALPWDGRTLQTPANQRVTAQVTLQGKGKVRLDELRFDRDQHYTRLGAPEIIEVPDGHYYMLGDNTLQSVDARGWTAITIGVDANDNVVPPETPGARRVRGNKRPMRLDDHPDRDETPIAIPSERALVMIDEYGEILRLNAMPGPGWGPSTSGTRVSFVPLDAQDGSSEWVAPDTTNTAGISFVPRADIQGRATLIFYPSRPFSWLFFNNWPDRFGFVR